MTRKRFVKLMMGEGCCKYSAEYRAFVATCPLGPGSYQEAWNSHLEEKERLYKMALEIKQALQEAGGVLSRSCGCYADD